MSIILIPPVDQELQDVVIYYNDQFSELGTNLRILS